MLSFAPRILKGFTDEAHVSAPQHASCSHAWLPISYGDCRWPQGHQQPTAQGSRSLGADDLQEVAPLLPTDGTSPPRKTLPRSRRLLRREDFLRVQEGGVRVTTRHLLILLMPRAAEVADTRGDTHGDETRLGIVASRKMGGAVRRNRAKRLVRETFRRNLNLFPPHVDLVVIVRSGIETLSQADVEAEVVGVASLLRKRASGRVGHSDRGPSKGRS